MKKISEIEKLEPRYRSLIGLMNGKDHWAFHPATDGRVQPARIPE